MGERTAGFKGRLASGEGLIVGTFVKTPAIEVVEVLALSGLDVLCLDAEHAPFDRARLDACLAIGRALDVPMLVRVSSAAPEAMLTALDSGAVGVVVPHVDSADKARAVAAASRYGRGGRGGRGYAGSSRWAGFATRGMPDVLALSAAETVVIAQIEDPEGVEAVDAIAATPGIDALLIGPADLSVSYGRTDLDGPELAAAFEAVGAACRGAGIPLAAWAPSAAKAGAWRRHGLRLVLTGSEHSWMLAGARAAVAEMRALG